MLHNTEFNLHTCCYGEFSLIIAFSLKAKTFLSILVTNRTKKIFVVIVTWKYKAFKSFPQDANKQKTILGFFADSSRALVLAACSVGLVLNRVWNIPQPVRAPICILLNVCHHHTDLWVDVESELKMGVLTSRPADMRTVEELQQEVNSPSAPLTGLEGALTVVAPKSGSSCVWLQALISQKM